MKELSSEQIVEEIESGVQAVIVCGLPGTGKSTLARKLRIKLGAVHLDTDRLRKGWSYVPDYSHRESEKNYRLLKGKGEKFLKKDKKVIFDGTFLFREGREDFYRMFKSVGVDFAVVYVQAEDYDVRDRLRPREWELVDPNDFSDATWGVYKEIKEGLKQGDFSTPAGDELERVYSYLSEGSWAKPATLMEVLDGIELALFSVDCWDKYEGYLEKIREFLDYIPSGPKKSIVLKEKIPFRQQADWDRADFLDGRGKDVRLKDQIQYFKIPSNKCLLIADNELALEAAEKWRISRISLSTLLSVLEDYPEPKNLKDPSRP